MYALIVMGYLKLSVLLRNIPTNIVEKQCELPSLFGTCVSVTVFCVTANSFDFKVVFVVCWAYFFICYHISMSPSIQQARLEALCFGVSVHLCMRTYLRLLVAYLVTATT